MVSRGALAAPDVAEFRRLLKSFLDSRLPDGRQPAGAQWGVYAFYDYDGEPIYVGQTNERLRVRVRRHLTNQRTDAVAMRVLDIFEVAAVEVWPLWELEGVAKSDASARALLNSLEYSVYLEAIRLSKFRAILNEKIPPISNTMPLPLSHRGELISEATRLERGHPDVRISRRAETLGRLAAVVRERGDVSPGLRRVIVVQAMRLAYLSAARYAAAENRPAPLAEAIDIEALVGSLQFEHTDPNGWEPEEEV